MAQKFITGYKGYKGCKGCLFLSGWSEFAKCKHPKITTTYAEIARKYDCGDSARYYEAKPPSLLSKAIAKLKKSWEKEPKPVTEFAFDTSKPRELYMWQDDE